MEFRILGPVEAYDGNQRIGIGHAQQRAVLAALLLELGRVTPLDQLIERVWGSEAPPSARAALYGHVARLRVVIQSVPEPGVRLSRRAGGYALDCDPDQVDATGFRKAVAEAAASDDDEQTADLLRTALAAWRGPALAGVSSPWLDGMRDALELERQAAVRQLNEIRLRQGRHAALAGELAELAERHPGDERLVAQLMLALYRSGRAADALAWYERTRRLGDNGGAGPQLGELHELILRGDPSLDWQPAAEPGGPADPVPADGPAAGDQARTAARLLPRQLPADVSAFTGRAKELAELDRLLADEAAAGVIAVSGTAGAGKTALAVHWAHRSAGQFPDGQLYVNLRGYDPGEPVPAADALAGFLGSLGVPGEGIPAGLDQRAALLRSLLAGRRMLVLLDNASDAEQVRPLLPGAAGCRVVVTSRDALAGLVARDGARRIELDVLPVADAVALLQAVIGLPDAMQGPARLLAERCARLPLALRVAAELTVTRPWLGLTELADELAGDPERLDLLDAGGDPRTAVRAVFSWSCRDLDEPAVAGFALLGLHPGPDLEPGAVAALAGLTQRQARQLLQRLARAHLIWLSPAGVGRYAMHDLLRAYARELTGADGGQAAQHAALTRLLDYYLHTAGAAMDVLYPAERHARPVLPPPADPASFAAEPALARAWLDQQMPCLVAAAGYAAAHGWPGHATRLARTLFRYLVTKGPAAQVVALHAEALRAARDLGDRAAEITLLIDLGGVEILLCHFGEAAGYLRQALALATQAGDQAAQARALGNLGSIDLALSRCDEAAGHYAQALDLACGSGDALTQARALHSLGTVSMLRGHHDESMACLRQAVDIAREAGDRVIEACALSQLAYCETARRQYRPATRNFSQALALARELGERSVEGYALGGLGTVQLGRGRYNLAAGLLGRAVTVFQQLGNRYGEAEMHSHLGDVLLADGQPAPARSQYATAQSLARQIGDRYREAYAVAGLASCCHDDGDDDSARRQWQQALDMFTAIGTAEADELRGRVAALGVDLAVIG